MPKFNFMRVFGVLCFSALIVITFLCYVGTQTEHIENSVLRLHIVANSNSEQDQQLKLLVRDEIIDRCGFLFENCETPEESARIAQNNLGFFKYVANDVISRNGYDYRVTCSVEHCAFPTKQYAMKSGTVLSLPSGEYNALNINIGEAAGQNWWCVMYPPLCFVDGVAEVTDTADLWLKSELSNSEYNLITDSDTPYIQIKFKIAELLK